MPRVARKPSRLEGRLSIVIAFTGDINAAYDAARRVVDAGTLQDAMLEYIAPCFKITNVEVK